MRLRVGGRVRLAARRLTAPVVRRGLWSLAWTVVVAAIVGPIIAPGFSEAAVWGVRWVVPIATGYTEDNTTAAKDYYAYHRGEFAELLATVDSGALGDPARWSDPLPLPTSLCHLSTNCMMSNFTSGLEEIERPHHEAVGATIYLPAAMGWRGNSVGFAHFDNSAITDEQFDGDGLAICPLVHVGDGWWWLEACTSKRVLADEGHDA